MLYPVILMDIFMPTMDGYEATGEIRALEAKFLYDKTMIVGCSAAYDDDTKQKCKEAGMDSLFGKPVKYDELKVLMTSEELSQWLLN